MKTSHLGKGLQSLIPKRPSKITSLIQGGKLDKRWPLEREVVFNIEIDKIKPNPHQPRKELTPESLKELADSIREHGILQPLLVTKIEKPTEWGGQQVEYQLVAGERRWKAAQLAGLPHVPVIIKETSEPQKLELALVENLQREDLNPIEAARAFKQLQEEFGLSQKEIAEKVGKSRVAITNLLRLLAAPKEIQQGLLEGRINEGHARAIMMADSAKQVSLYQQAIKYNLSVRQLEERARRLVKGVRPHHPLPPDPALQDLIERLQKVLKTKVRIRKSGQAGQILIGFSSLKELKNLIVRLSKL